MPEPIVTFLGLKITNFLKMRFFKHSVDKLDIIFISYLRMKVRQVWESLMSHEMMLVNSIENMIVEYESRLGAMTNGFLDKAGALIQQARFDFIIVIFKKYCYET